MRAKENVPDPATTVHRHAPSVHFRVQVGLDSPVRLGERVFAVVADDHVPVFLRKQFDERLYVVCDAALAMGVPSLHLAGCADGAEQKDCGKDFG